MAINIKNLPTAVDTNTDDYVIIEQTAGTKKVTIDELTKTGTVVHCGENTDVITLQKPEMVEKVNNMENNINTLSSKTTELDTKIDTKVSEITSQLDTIAQEVEKPITLNKCDEEMLGAIQNKEGETTFNLLSIPRDKSVTSIKTTFATASMQYIDLSSRVKGAYYWYNGDTNTVSTAENAGYDVFPKITLESGKYYFTQIVFGFTFIKNLETNVVKTLSDILNESGIVADENTAYNIEINIPYNFEIYVCVKASATYPMFANGRLNGETTIYGEYNLKFDNVNVKEVNEKLKDVKLEKNIIVGTSGNAEFNYIEEALLYINTLSDNIIYNIMLEDGTYYFNMYKDDVLKDYVNIIGMSGDRDKCIIDGSLSDNAEYDNITWTSTFNITKNNRFKNVTIIAKNSRYCIHSESGGVEKDWTQILDNCRLLHKGNQGAIDYRTANNGDVSQVWTSCHAWGEGSSSGAYAEFNNCSFESPNGAWYVHEPNVTDGTKPYVHILNNCTFIDTTISSTPYWNGCVGIDSVRDRGYINTIILNNCSINNGKIDINGTIPINVIIKGCNNVYVRRIGNDNNYPTTDYTVLKTYIGEEDVAFGDILMFVDGINLVKKANANTDKNLIAGIAVGTCKKNELIKIINKTYFTKTGNFGDKLYLADNGKIATTGTTQIGVCLGECSLLV